MLWSQSNGQTSGLSTNLCYLTFCKTGWTGVKVNNSHGMRRSCQAVEGHAQAGYRTGVVSQQPIHFSFSDISHSHMTHGTCSYVRVVPPRPEPSLGNYHRPLDHICQPAVKTVRWKILGLSRDVNELDSDEQESVIHFQFHINLKQFIQRMFPLKIQFCSIKASLWSSLHYCINSQCIKV